MNFENQFSGGLTWFYWIAGLSVINSIINIIGYDWNFIAGLGITQIIDAFAYYASDTAKIVAFVLNVIIAGFYVFLGLIAKGKRKWVFILGIILYGIDSLIFLWVQDWISIIFHMIALYEFFKAIKAIKNLSEVEKQLEELQ